MEEYPRRELADNKTTSLNVRRVEVERRLRVVDQMITAYSILRDRYARWGNYLTLTVFFCAVSLCTLTFAPSDFWLFKELGLSEASQGVLMGLLSSVLLFVSIAQLSLRWPEKSQCFGGAAEKLAKAKIQTRNFLSTKQEISSQRFQEISRRLDLSLEDLPRVPEREFITLKSAHVRKMKLSKMIDQNPGVPVLIQQMMLLNASLRGRHRGAGMKSAQDPTQLKNDDCS